MRDKFVDCLKGYACILVVFGHVIMGIRKAMEEIPIFSVYLEQFIWTFHVALFMFLSGYVYRITGGWQTRGRKGFVLHKLLNLGVPYFAFSTLYIVINSSVSGVNNESKMTDILYLWRDSIAQYWFLYALFGLFVLYTVLSSIMNNWQITITLVLTLYLAPAFNVSFGSFGASMHMAMAFGLGTSVQNLIVDKQKSYVKVGVIISHLIMVGFLIYTGYSGLLIIDLFEQFLGIVASIAFISMLVQINLIKKGLLFINKYSFPLYLMHTIFTAATRIIFLKFDITNWLIHVIAGTISGISIPIMVAWIVNRIPLIDFFMYPSKNIKRIKENRLKHG